MSRRKITLLVLAVVMAIGLTGGIVWAQTDGNGGTPTPTPTTTPTADTTTGKSFVARVADVLELEESTVQDAFTQAKRQQIDEAYKGRLDKMVERGRMTEDEANDQFDWFQERPASAVERSRHGRSDGKGFHRRGSKNGEIRWGHRGGRGGWRDRGGSQTSPMDPSPTEQPSS